ncbi:MAG: hypothetical protein CBC16_05665 [Verrucomicrobia bacterium TMED56]|jgi:hypothetical protein|nr:MAG: hypothetical protein CBC16_05665 [Verrucomicrobia bacterium TMED56]|tara:strand:- start:3607 stop:4365 length:759 start_codon:yes stop_codon:yes gene_type:complete
MNNIQTFIMIFQYRLRPLAILGCIVCLGCEQKFYKKGYDVEIAGSTITDETGLPVSPSEWTVEFSEDFSRIEVGSEPESLFILDGAYTVQTDQDQGEILALPGSPVGDFGLLFGPRIKDKALELRFSFFSTNKGRRKPSIAAGIGGIRGLRLRLNPAAKNLVLSSEEKILKTLPFLWTAGQWWSVRFQMVPEDSFQSTVVKYKLWPKLEEEPSSWLVSEKFSLEYKGGKCALWGFPYASTPILFDDLSIHSK